MKPDQMTEALEQAATHLGVRVRYETMTGETAGSGGLCKVKGEHRVIVDKRATDGEKVTVLAQALSRFPLDDVFMSEKTRDLIAKSAAFVRNSS